MSSSSRGGARSRVRTWLQLVRAPNLFTVPGDPLAGYLLASPAGADGTVWLGILASLCLYAAGLLLNDLADLEEDRRDRPKRPLPSGAATVRQVWIVSLLLSLLGLGALAASGKWLPPVLGVALLGAICLYNFRTKHWPGIGALNMGLCRSLSVMVGASLGAGVYVLPLAGAIAIGFGVYIAAVTNLARFETMPQVPVTAKVWPGAVAFGIALAGILSYTLSAPARMPATFIFGAVMLSAVWLMVRVYQAPAGRLPPLIGAHIRLLLPLQAGVAWMADPWEVGWIAALLLLLMWPLAKWVSRWFYAS